MRDQHKLRFPLLSDAGNKVARQFGLTYRVPDEQSAVYQRAFVNLPFVNGDDSWELPIPATYIIDRDWHGALRFRERGLHGASRAGGHRAFSDQHIGSLKHAGGGARATPQLSIH